MRCSQTRIHSALPFTAPPLLFVCRLPPISTAARPVTNTVGYQNKSLATGSNAFVCQTILPMNTAAEAVTLGDILPTDGADGWAYDTDFLATLKPNGNKNASYGYLSPYWANKYFEDEQAGWYDLSVCQDEEFDGATKKNDVQIPAGQAFLVYTAGSGIELVVPSPL